MQDTSDILDDKLTKSFRFQNRELLDNYVILAVTNNDGIIKHISTNLCNIFNYKPDELLNKPYSFLIKRDFIKNFENEFNQCIEYKSVYKGEIKHVSSKNELIWTDTIITPLFDDDNNHIGFILASNNITEEKKLKRINEDNMLKRKQNNSLLEFMPSISAAVLLKTSSGLHKLLWIITFTIFISLLWANFSKIDDIVKTDGKVVTTKNIQTISTLDGGVLEEVFVKEGDFVKKGDLLLKISDIEFKTQYIKNKNMKYSLLAKLQRLKAQASSSNLVLDEEVIKYDKGLMQSEVELYNTNIKRVNSSIEVLKEQLQQRKNDLQDSLKNLNITKNSYELLQKELEIKRPLVKERIISPIDYLQVQRTYNDTKAELETLKGSIPTLKSSIKEVKNSIKEVKELFISESQDEYVKSYAELKNIQEEMKYLKEKIVNSIIKAPNDGVINKISVKTKGEAISPGLVIMEIIPEAKYLLAEVKVDPADIGFLYIGQHVKLKLRAYDFSIYGGVKGTISYISADTLIDEKNDGKEVYIVQIQSPQKYVGDNKALKIKPGMTVDADIITGKKSVLDFILKPIIRSLDI